MYYSTYMANTYFTCSNTAVLGRDHLESKMYDILGK